MGPDGGVGGDGHDEGVVWVCVGMQGVHELMMMIIVVRVRQGKRDVRSIKVRKGRSGTVQSKGSVKKSVRRAGGKY